MKKLWSMGIGAMIVGMFSCNSSMVLNADVSAPVISMFAWSPVTMDGDGRGKIEIRALATDNQGIEILELWRDGALLVTSRKPMLLMVDDLQEFKTYHYLLKAFDHAGNSSSKALDYTVQFHDGHPPAIPVVEANQNHFSAPDRLRLTIHAQDDHEVARVHIYKQGQPVQTLVPEHPTSTFEAIFTDDLKQAGSYSYQVMVEDAGGNTSSLPAPLLITVDL